AVGGIADQRFVAARELFAEPGDDRLPLGALAFRLDLVAAQDVAGRTELDLLDEELGLAPRAIDEQRRQGLLVLEHKTADDGAAALAAPRMYSSDRAAMPQQSRAIPRTARAGSSSQLTRRWSRQSRANSSLLSVFPGNRVKYREFRHFRSICPSNISKTPLLSRRYEQIP